MKNIYTVLLINTLCCVVFISCIENLKSKNINQTINDKDSIDKSQSNKNSNILTPIPTIKIGQQEWMVRDIQTTIYNNGDSIIEARTEKQWKDCGSKKLGCFRILKNGTYVYNGFAVNDERGIIPAGFVLPTFTQFNQLTEFLGGGDSQSGKATKSMATYSIFIEDWVGDQETGGLEEVEIKVNGKSRFNAKEGGYVYDQGSIGNEGNCSYWWTASTEGGSIIVKDIGYCSQDLGGGKGSYPKSFGFAVRALKK